MIFFTMAPVSKSRCTGRRRGGRSPPDKMTHGRYYPGIKLLSFRDEQKDSLNIGAHGDTSQAQEERGLNTDLYVSGAHTVSCVCFSTAGVRAPSERKVSKHGLAGRHRRTSESMMNPRLIGYVLHPRKETNCFAKFCQKAHKLLYLEDEIRTKSCGQVYNQTSQDGINNMGRNENMKKSKFWIKRRCFH